MPVLSTLMTQKETVTWGTLVTTWCAGGRGRSRRTAAIVTAQRCHGAAIVPGLFAYSLVSEPGVPHRRGAGRQAWPDQIRRSSVAMSRGVVRVVRDGTRAGVEHPADYRGLGRGSRP